MDLCGQQLSKQTSQVAPGLILDCGQATSSLGASASPSVEWG